MIARNIQKKQATHLKSIIEEAAKRYGKKIAIICKNYRLSFIKLDQESNKVANTFIKLGVKRNDRVALLLQNSPDFAIIYFGIVKVGAIAVPLDTRYKVVELASMFKSCQPKVLVADSAFLEPLIPALSRFKYINHIIELNGSYPGEYLAYRDIILTTSQKRPEIEVSQEDTAHIAYTSGPTLHPRGAMISHYNLLKVIETNANALQQSDKDVVMLYALPLHHAFGLVVILLASVFKGSTVVMVPGTGLSINSLMETIEREKGTILLGVPYIFALAIKLARREGIRNDLSSLRLCGSGGAPLSLNVIKQFKRYYGYNLIDFWGLTEAIAIVTFPPQDGITKPGTVGRVLPGWVLKIVDNNNIEQPINISGEIIIKGPMMDGYYRNPEATAEIIRKGWLYTGDIGYLDKDGYLHLCGRKKEMIILKGQNVYPNDIEQIIFTHPKIAAVKVFGIPDRLRGEIVGAVIRSKEKVAATTREIKRFCQEQMADYKLPKQIIFAPSLSKFSHIKIGKKKLKDFLSNMPNLSYPQHKQEPR